MEAIDLSSDSNDSVSYNESSLPKSSENNGSVKTSSDARSAFCISDDEFDFPEVPFAQQAVKQTYSEPESLFSKLPQKSNSNIEEELLNKYLIEPSTSKPTTVAKNKNGLSNYDKELLSIQKLKKAEEAARIKAEKAEIAKRLKSMKPGECMKYMKVMVDSGIKDLSFFDNLISEFHSLELMYEIKTQIVPNSITWARSTKEQSNLFSEENHVIIIWDCAETVNKIADDTFLASIMSIAALIAGKAITLVIYGMEKYFKEHMNLKKKHAKNQFQGKAGEVVKRRGSKAFKDLPVVSQRELEMRLIEIQLKMNCNSQCIETPQQLGMLINQYTKAIAETPFKLQKRETAQSQLDWYSAADNKDTVKVDKNGNGLKRLWQQQLCQFNLAKLETAEAIISQYPTPLQLMEAYANCTSSEGEKLLQDIAIRRTAGPLTAVRRIGPELSKKLYLMFTTEDGDILLGNESENLCINSS